MSHKIYVASSWRNSYQPDIVRLLIGEGHEVYDFRNPKPGDNGFHWSEITTDWQDWTTHAFRDALWHPIAQQGFRSDMSALKWAEVVVLLLPSGRSAHVEAAWACGQGKPVIIHMPEKCEPELMYKMFNAITCDGEELKWILRHELTGLGQFILSDKS